MREEEAARGCSPEPACPLASTLSALPPPSLPPPPLQAGIEKCPRLRVLYASNNRIRDWGEVDRLASLPELEDLLLTGNPLQTEARDSGGLGAYRLEVLRRLPALKKLDGQAVDVEEREAARGKA